MERSVQFVVTGGIVLVAGLWLFAAGDRIGQWHYGGIAIALAGVVAFAVGITQDLTYGPFGE